VERPILEEGEYEEKAMRLPSVHAESYLTMETLLGNEGGNSHSGGGVLKSRKLKKRESDWGVGLAKLLLGGAFSLLSGEIPGPRKESQRGVISSQT